MIKLLIWLLTRRGDFYRAYMVGGKAYAFSVSELKSLEQRFREIDSFLRAQGTSLEKEFGFTPDEY